MNLTSPKQQAKDRLGRSAWYPYYAGYSTRFVHDVIEEFGVSKSAVVLDPWNGAGTTTQVACDKGINAVGVDINPVMARIAKARLINPDRLEFLNEAVEKIAARASKYRTSRYFPDDPLGRWFTLETVTRIRHVERAVREVLCDDDVHGYTSTVPVAPSVEGSFAYTALFQLLRKLIEPFRASNPTWIRMGAGGQIGSETLAAQFRAIAIQMLLGFDQEIRNGYSRAGNSEIHINVGLAQKLGLQAASVDLVVASPPYCTRIDYAVGTSVELALLGLDTVDGFRRLRDRSTGTSTVRCALPAVRDEWGKKCNEFLIAVRDHDSRASKSYYLKTHLQYYEDLYNSICEIARCLRAHGRCVLVVQDSYYKDVHNDLAGIIREMCESVGLKMTNRQDFIVDRHLSSVNAGARQYRDPTRPVESVLIFQNQNQSGGANGGHWQCGRNGPGGD